MSKGFVYLIVEVNEKGQEKFKIGVTKNNPKERLKKLKTGNSNELEVLKFYESENYKRIEKWFHMKYASRKTIAKNEFFSLTDDQVINFIKDCKEIDSIINLMKEQNPFYK
jgi:RNA processing factor Prp31